MDRKKKKKNGGMYVAICCCALVIAIVGYANRAPEEKTEQTPVGEIAEVKQQTEQVSGKVIIEEPEKTVKPTVKPTEKPKPQKQEKKEEKIAFTAPVAGKVTGEYSGDDLVYNEALKDWRAHSGVDFEAAMGGKVKVSAPGVVEEVFDSSLGRCVVVNHKNGFKTMYANLDENTSVKVGDELSADDIVGTIGNTALGDITDDAHLHFEIMQGKNNVNPVEYLE